jgi:flagellar motor switch protein FliM
MPEADRPPARSGVSAGLGRMQRDRMDEPAAPNMLRRKLAASEAEPPPGRTGGVARPALRAVRMGLARAALELFDLTLGVIAITQSRCTIADLSHRLSGDRLWAPLTFDDAPVGAIALDRAAVSALVGHQTTGRIGKVRPADRPFTAIDAALVAPLVDLACDKAAAMLEADIIGAGFEKLRFGMATDDLAELLLTLEAERFQLYDLTVEFDGGAGQGRFQFALPEIAAPATKEETDDEDDSPRFDQAFAPARVTLSAVLCELTMSLEAVAQLKAGDLIEIPVVRLDKIEMHSIASQVVARGRLGQSAGLRAIRLNEVGVPFEPDEGAVEDGFTPAPMPGAPPDKDPRVADAEAALAALDRDIPPLDTMSPDEAALEISSLAGLVASDAKT